MIGFLVIIFGLNINVNNSNNINQSNTSNTESNSYIHV